MKPYFFLQSGDTYHLKVNPSCSKYTHEETVRYPCILHARILMDTPMRSPFQILDHSMTIDCKEDVIKTHKCKIVCTKTAWSGQGYHYHPPPPSQPSPTFSGTHSGTVRIKCFAQGQVWILDVLTWSSAHLCHCVSTESCQTGLFAAFGDMLKLIFILTVFI